jgi:neutral trehalase
MADTQSSSPIAGPPQRAPSSEVQMKSVAATPASDFAGHRTRFHSGLFEQRDRSASGLPEGYGAGTSESDGLGIQLLRPEVDGAGEASINTLNKTVAGRGRLALYALLSLLGAVALSVTIYFISRPKIPAVSGSPYVRSCSVFCHGPLLSAVQSSRLYNDSKTFVDQPILADPEEVLAAFEASFGGGRDTPPTRQEISAFVSQFFLTAGSDTEPFVPHDYSPMPPQLARVSNATLMDFALGLNDLWLQLGRRIVDSVKTYPQRFSLVWQPYPLIVPGGRFLESYYWDSYWIVLGLLRSGMTETAQGVILNLVHLLDTFGFVPNGGRVYYSLPGRSQPPMLSAMVRELYQQTGNLTFLAQIYPSLLNEYSFWMKQGDYGHAVTIQKGGKAYTLNRYVTTQLIPRPESWLEVSLSWRLSLLLHLSSQRCPLPSLLLSFFSLAFLLLQDVMTAQEAGFNITDPGAQILYSEIAAGAETGWDFSSRWFGDGVDLTTSDTSRVIPVELNSLLYGVESDLAYFASVLGQKASNECKVVFAAAAAATTAASSGSTTTMDASSGDDGQAFEAAVRKVMGGSYDRTTVSACLMMQSHPVCSSSSASSSAPSTTVAATESSDTAMSATPSSNYNLGWAGIKPQGRASHHHTMETSKQQDCSSSISLSLSSDSLFFQSAASNRAEAIEALLWDDTNSKWDDLRILGSYTEVLGHHQQQVQAQGTASSGGRALSSSSSSHKEKHDMKAKHIELHPRTAIHRSLKAVEEGKFSSNGKKNGGSSSSSASSCTTLSSSAPMDATSDPNLHDAVRHYFASSGTNAVASTATAMTITDADDLLIYGVNVFPVTNFTTVGSTSSYIPLFTKAFDLTNTTRIKRIVKSLQNSYLFLAGGLTSTTANTTQQWDRPNGWAPLQHMVIMGLNKTQVPEAQAFARELARVWVLSNLESYRMSGFMPEKMDAAVLGRAGGGGEYAPQVGFGWSNGVVLDLICSYDFPNLEPTYNSFTYRKSATASSSSPSEESASSASS